MFAVAVVGASTAPKLLRNSDRTVNSNLLRSITEMDNVSTQRGEIDSYIRAVAFPRRTLSEELVVFYYLVCLVCFTLIAKWLWTGPENGKGGQPALAVTLRTGV